MAEQNPRRTPLAGAAGRLAAVEGDVRMAEVPFLTQIDLRLDPAGAAAKELGFPLPTDPGTSVRSGDLTVLWLGPDEWLIVAPPGAEDRLTAQLRAAAGTELVSIVDVSAQRTTLALGGPRVRELLALGCTLDLHPRVFGVGDCAQTVLAHAPVVLLRRDDDFLILVRASFAGHLAEWLLDAAVEFTTAPA